MKEERYLTIQLGSKSSLKRIRNGETIAEWKERVKAKKEAAEAKRERRRQRNLKLYSLIVLFGFYFLSNGHGII